MAQKKGAEEAQPQPAYGRWLGNIRVSVWANKKENGEVWFNTTITRSYHDGKEWQDATGFSHSDLPVVVVAACMAYFWIWEQRVLDPQKQEAAA